MGIYFSTARTIAVWLLVWAGVHLLLATVRGHAQDSPVSFAHDIRPILSEHCFHCHGPDADQREADLRLDHATPFRGSDDSPAIVVAGKPDESELFARISSTDQDLKMPPLEAPTRLKPEQVELIRRWIEQGAHWQPHWAFIPPQRSPSPMADVTDWPRNTIDHFILARLRQRGLAPSPEADKPALIRRVSLDLTGLPPTPEEVDRFLADTAPNAYEQLVDRLLASPRYGEQMAATWLDAARYADSYGYQDDGELSMWRWRDWVIEAFNANMPFDQFTIEQLAGDLLPNPTLDERIATGFNRNHRHNSEGGAISEEFRVEYVVDRVDTTATVWLGMTFQCARCHDHKFDPITQQEFYQFFAFFNNINEEGRARKEGNTPPLMAAPTREQRARQRQSQAELEAVRRTLNELEPRLVAAQSAWEKTVDRSTLPPVFSIARDLMVHLPLNESLVNLVGENEDGEKNEDAVFEQGEAAYGQGPSSTAAMLDGKRHISAGDLGGFSSDNRATIAIWVRPAAADGVILSKIESEDDPQDEGYSLILRDGHLRVHLTAQWVDDAIRLETTTKLPLDRWTHVAITYDGLYLSDGIKVYFDGELQLFNVELDSLFQGFGNEGPLRIGTAGDPANRFHGGVDDLRIYDDDLTAEAIAILAVAEPIAELLAIPHAQRTQHQSHKIRTYFIEHHAPAEIRDASQRVDALQRHQREFARSIPTVMVMEELPKRRPTYLLERGQYDAPGEQVAPAVPALFSQLPKDAPRNRLGLAQWLTSDVNPLTARVTVNRLWQMSFDKGLVKTAEDFGSQGETPSHPQLLDWLATELVAVDWDLKAVRRLIVTSAAYRQQSHATPALLATDPENRLFARGPRFRLPAETIRDQALLASGLLVEKLGGPSVRPYQPAGLWEELNDDEYEQDTGEKLYRRSLYTFWKRTITHPLMGTFDAASREVCSVREGRTNTPLQALTLMNEEGFVEAARVLAERVMLESGPQPQDRLARAFRLATARAARPQELEILQAGFEQHLAHFSQHLEEAQQLVSQGERPRREQLDVAELASYTTIASMLLNLDEVVTQH